MVEQKADEGEKEPEESRQLLVFRLASEEYGVNVMKVGEVIKAIEKTIKPIPNSKDFIKGITNVRGQVIPIIDLETKFGLEPDDHRLIVLLEIDGSTCGIMVDEVKEVLRVNEKRIKSAPEVLRDKIHRQYVDDVALLEDERMIIILDIDSGFQEEEQIAMNDISDEDEDEEEDETEEVSEEEVKKKAEEMA
jgi:purine-binding chemotaxis protein CheW